MSSENKESVFTEGVYLLNSIYTGGGGGRILLNTFFDIDAHPMKLQDFLGNYLGKY